jgi:hypothetical protein
MIAQRADLSGMSELLFCSTPMAQEQYSRDWAKLSTLSLPVIFNCAPDQASIEREAASTDLGSGSALTNRDEPSLRHRRLS